MAELGETQSVDLWTLPLDSPPDRLEGCGIETRPFFHPLHRLPPYRHCRSDNGCPIATATAARGVMLPTHTRLTEDDVRTVIDELAARLRQRIEA